MFVLICLWLIFGCVGTYLLLKWIAHEAGKVDQELVVLGLVFLVFGPVWVLGVLISFLLFSDWSGEKLQQLTAYINSKLCGGD